MQQQQQYQQQQQQLRCTLAGPLCFAGDSLGDVWLPSSSGLPQRGDDAVVLDCGANSLALFSRHCSRPAPGVWLVWQDEQGRPGAVCVKEQETLEQVLAFWS